MADQVTQETPHTLTIDDILAMLPHRYPFLMIDRIVEVERGKRIVAIKNVTINEPFFQGHFPGYPIMPGVLVVEAMAQAGGALVLLDAADPTEKLLLLTGVDGARFRRPITPGDQLRIDVSILQIRSRAVRLEGKVFVDGLLAVEATLSCGVVPRSVLGKTNGGLLASKPAAKTGPAAPVTAVPVAAVPVAAAPVSPAPIMEEAPAELEAVTIE